MSSAETHLMPDAGQPDRPLMAAAIAPPPGSPVRDGTRPQQIARAALALGLLLLGLYTLQEFLTALIWALIFAVALWPLYRRVRLRPGGRRHTLLIPLAFTLGVALVFIVPLVLVGVQLGKEAHEATEWVRQAQQNGIPEPDILRKLPYGEPTVSAWWHDNLAEPGGAKDLIDRFSQGRSGEWGRTVGRAVVHRLTLFAFTLVTLFFLFREGRTVVAQLRRASTRAFGPGGERIGRQIVASIHGTVNGLVLVGLGEGVVLGVVYALTGVPHVTVFGALTAVAAMIPFAAPLIFGAAALLLAAQGAIAGAIIVVVTGFAVTFIADHFIRPVLIGGATQLPFIWVLLGILGGVEVWGLIGLFIGPAIMAALILMWREYAGDGTQPTPQPTSR
jgi:predicted PurR-regulated permease PerM